MDEKKAMALFNEGYHCPQIVLMGAAELMDMDKDMAVKLSSGFGAGMQQGSVCGCITGALMALGLQYGFTDAEGVDETELKAKCKELYARFVEKFGGDTCAYLLGGNITVPEDAEIIKKEGRSLNRCPKFVAGTVEILKDLLED